MGGLVPDMAAKRMFSREIVQSDAFLDMPASSQALYFHLGMEADDDGFVGNPKRLQKVLGASEDDFKILLGKRFVLLFPSGVLVVKHHRINNKWDAYNCRRTPYLDEFHQLYIKQNKAYTLDASQGQPIQSVPSLKAVSRIDKNRIDKTHALESAEPIREEKDETTRSGGSLGKGAKQIYEPLVVWAEQERGAPFLSTHKLKQYKALKMARDNKIKAAELKERWQDMASDKFWASKGFDWLNVVNSFNTKPA